MKIYKVSENFVLQEFIHPDIFNARVEKSIELIDYRIILGAQTIRNFLNKSITINNWHRKGIRIDSGLRKFASKTGALWSQHKFGRAIDFIVEGMDNKEVYQLIINNWYLFSPYFTTIEHIDFTPSWIHLDCRYVQDQNINGVNIVRP